MNLIFGIVSQSQVPKVLHKFFVIYERLGHDGVRDDGVRDVYPSRRRLTSIGFLTSVLWSDNAYRILR